MTGSGLVELIDVETETRLGAPLRISRDAITDANAGAPSGTGIYFGPADGPVVYYELDPASWAETACAAAGRNLTRAEWDRYLVELGPYRATCPQFPEAATG